MAKNIAVKQRRLPPQRTCVSCRRVMEKRHLLRIVRTPEGKIAMDPGGKMSGRGAYLCREHRCWSKALGSQRLGKALKCTLVPGSLDAVKEYAQTLNPEALGVSNS